MKNLMIYLLLRLRTDEEGQSLVEYGLLIAMLAVAVLVALYGFSGGTEGLYEQNVETLIAAMQAP